jgi:hypothetical protein
MTGIAQLADVDAARYLKGCFEVVANKPEKTKKAQESVTAS